MTQPGEAAPRHRRKGSVRRSSSSRRHPRGRLEDVRLPDIIKDYKESDVFNCDETGLFFLQSSNRSLTMPGGDAHGVKQDKKRLTLLLTASWMGEKEKPLMIWKSENPRALKGTDKSKLPVT